jgi:hypothetical protein
MVEIFLSLRSTSAFLYSTRRAMQSDEKAESKECKLLALLTKKGEMKPRSNLRPSTTCTHRDGEEKGHP